MKNFLLPLIRCIHVFIRFRFVIICCLFITLMLSSQKFMMWMLVLNKRVFARIFRSTQLIFWAIQFHPYKWNLIKMINCLKTLLKKSFKEWINIRLVQQSKSSSISSLNLMKKARLISIDAWLTFHKLNMSLLKYQFKMKTKSKKNSLLSIYTLILCFTYLITSFLICRQILLPPTFSI